MTEDYVSFENAKLLKDKGFDECPLFRYDDCGQLWVQGGYDKTKKWHFPAPTLQMAMKWLMERGWFICIIPLAFYCGEKAVKFGYNIWAGDNLEVDEFSTPKFNTYNEACESAIKYCLENLI